MRKKKRFCFISLNNMYLCPYIEKYTNLMKDEYDVIYWDRHDVGEDIGAVNHYRFNINMEEGQSKFRKVLGYIKFKNYALKVLKENKYDGLVILQTSVSLLLNKELISRYNKRYVLDIRDYTLEKNFLFYHLLKNIIKKSYITVISSKGYEEFLPKNNYTLVHNDVDIDAHKIYELRLKEKVKKIRISCIGLIRFHDQNKKVIEKFKNDSRFVLKFIGKDAYALKSFCVENDIKNVVLIDQFNPEDTLDYYRETDIVYNLYGNNSPLLDYALSNKLYYAAKLARPILVSPGTFMESVSTKFNFGYSVNLEDPLLCNNLYEYYQSLNQEDLIDNCEEFLSEVKKDNVIFNKRIQKFFSEN
ncbi:capsular biosynthesis protein [Planococcus sp. 11815]|uniref:capsular polysaccharide biosynthesis protein Cps4G n=1 Tax=Planococcus sp. 11815 TaxID=2939413 RepID=UPI003DA3D8E0